MSSFRSAAPASSGSGFWSIERIVALATPAFGLLAGWLATVVGQLIPGINIPRDQFVALFVAGFTAAVAAALKWLHGRQKFVNFIDDSEKVAQSVIDKLKADQLAGPALSDIESILAQHTGAIIDAVGKAVHAPPTADEVAKQIIGEIAGGKAAPSAGAGAAEQGAAPVTGS